MPSARWISTAFYAAYRRDGRSRPAYDPAMMVALLLYAYARGTRSSRQIERACEEDVAFRVMAAQQRPDHATIARFVERHQDAIAGLFGEVLSLCAKQGLASVGVIAVDGTKLPGNASRNANVDYEQLAREILEEAKPSTRPRTSSTATRAATSCPSSCAPGRAGGRGCARPSASSKSSARRKRGRCRASRAKRLKEAKRRLDEELGPRCAPTAPTSTTGRDA